MRRLSRSTSVFVTGHEGLLGSALCTELRKAGFEKVLTVPRSQLDLTNQEQTCAFLKRERPGAVVHCAALVGGIRANIARPGDFITQNLEMQVNVIHGSHLADVEHLVFFGSNCMYPSDAAQPLKEDSLLSGPIEKSNLAYGIAKAAGLVQVRSYLEQFGRRYFTVIPASLYGPNDNFDLETGHVTPSLLLRFHQAKEGGVPEVVLWGTGKPRRELLHAADAARAVILLLDGYDAQKGPINVGYGDDYSVEEIGRTIAEVVGFEGKVSFDTSKPDGAARKLLDSSRIEAMGFKPELSLTQGLKQTYDWLVSAPKVRGWRK
jgi:GDP-L-fucose synthase